MLDSVRQAAAIPFREDRVCLVRSSSGKRWVFPKGLIDPGHTAREAAEIEAWEEAGLIGTIHPDSIGSYVYEKYGREHHVQVFRMNAIEVRDDWPEKSLRRRIWMTLGEAIESVDESELKEILSRLSEC